MKEKKYNCAKMNKLAAKLAKYEKVEIKGMPLELKLKSWTYLKYNYKLNQTVWSHLMIICSKMHQLYNSIQIKAQ